MIEPMHGLIEMMKLELVWKRYQLDLELDYHLFQEEATTEVERVDHSPTVMQSLQFEKSSDTD